VAYYTDIGAAAVAGLIFFNCIIADGKGTVAVNTHPAGVAGSGISLYYISCQYRSVPFVLKEDKDSAPAHGGVISYPVVPTDLRGTIVNIDSAAALTVVLVNQIIGNSGVACDIDAAAVFGSFVTDNLVTFDLNGGGDVKASTPSRGVTFDDIILNYR